MIDFNCDLFGCKDVACVQHCDMLQYVYEDVLAICMDSADECIPKVNTGKGKQQWIHGWNDKVVDYHQEALYWNYWQKVECRRHQGHTSEMIRITRTKYYTVLKMVRIDHDLVRKEKMAEAVNNNNCRYLFAEVRKMNARKKSNPVSVDGMTGDEEISQLFSNKQEQLYYSVPCDSNVFEKINRKINEGVLNERDASYGVGVDDVVNTVKHLKSANQVVMKASILTI